MAIIQQLPRGPRVRLTASVSLSIPAWSADLDFWSNAISLEAALTINRFFACCELNLLPCCNRLTLLFFNPPCTREIQKLNTIRNPFPQTGKEKKKEQNRKQYLFRKRGQDRRSWNSICRRHFLGFLRWDPQRDFLWRRVDKEVCNEMNARNKAQI